MELGIEAARWVVGKALGPASSGLLEAWAASTELGPNIEALRIELLYAQGMLNNAQGRGRGLEIQNPALKELLHKLRELAYRADDVMDELDYFRIQDELDGTYHAADEHAGGCLLNHALNARHTASNIAKMLGFSKCSRRSASSHDDEPDDEDTGGRGGVSCGGWPCLGFKTPNHDDDEQEEEDAVSRGAVWPCAVMPGCFSQCSRGSSAGRNDEPGQEKEEDAGASSTPQPKQGNREEAHGGCMGRLATIHHTVGKHLPCYSVSNVQNDANTNNVTSAGRRRFLCCAHHNKAPQIERVVQTPKLKFDRVEMSRKMEKIVEQLKPVCSRVSTILNLELMDSSRSIAQCIGTNLDTWFSKGQWPMPLHKNPMMSRPITTPEFREPTLYGREHDKSGIVYDIIEGKYCEEDLTILPIVGPGGIGKTTLTQYIYKELENHFQVKLWVCVSVNFNVSRLTQEIADKITGKDAKDNPNKRIEEKLKSKRFLLVLDDMWNCSNVDEWNRFLVPFRNVQTKGSIILVTTRFPALAQMVKTTDHWKDLKGLDEEEFKKLFIACVFDDKNTQNEHSELLETIGYEIVKKLKGSPLAAKTVGRLLRNHLDLSHWTRVLESKEWESQNGHHDIMPALKLSFDYLPFHLQQCFTYSALFTEDYKFGKEEIIHFWIGLDVLHSRGENKSIEDIGLSHLIELVNHGFFKKEEGEHGCNYYIIHDLLHELAIKVSADECLSIRSSNNVRSLQTPPSIRHLSISIDESSVNDKKTFDICKEDFSVLEKRLKVENLHSLMLFGKHHGSFVNIFHSLFSKTKAVRVIFISGRSYNLEQLLHNFSNLVHLRYLRIESVNSNVVSRPPKCISRFYHLRILDIEGWGDCNNLATYMSNLLKLRHLIFRRYKMHSLIFEGGELKSVQDMRRFEIKKETRGFELRHIGHLLELCGSLGINNLEHVEGREEANEAKLIHRKHLHELRLNWSARRSNKDPAREEEVLEGLRPHDNLLDLIIREHGGATCPSWLGADLSVKKLESLCLDGVAWRMFPPIGELWLVNEGAEEILSNIPGQHFKNLKRIELSNLAKLKRWVVGNTDQLLSHLEVVIIGNCPELVELPFSKSNCSEQQQKTMCPRLQLVRISSCPKLLALPPVPWTSARCSVKLSGVGLGCEQLHYGKDRFDHDVLTLVIIGKNAQDTMAPSFWTTLDFDKLTRIEKLVMNRCSALPLDGLQKLSSTIKSLQISNLNMVSVKVLTQVISYMPKLSQLYIDRCENITVLGVAEQPKEATSISMEEEDIDEGFLLLPSQSQLEQLQIQNCPELKLQPHGENGGDLQGLCFLHSLEIWNCPKFLTCYFQSSSSSCFPFPTSLQSLRLVGVETLAPLSNLSSLTELWILGHGRGDLGGVGLGRLLAHGCLCKLTVSGATNFFSIGSERLEQEPSFSSSSKPQSLKTDDAAGVLAAPICRLLSSSLTSLTLYDKKIDCVTKEQDEALQLLTSLQELHLMDCHKLQYLPVGLQKLTSLKILEITRCKSIRQLPKDSLPNSLQKLTIDNCSALRSLPMDGLPDSLQELVIWYCPSIRGRLPKGGLPSSLQILNVRNSRSKELRSRCRKLIGTIPIVYA